MPLAASGSLSWLGASRQDIISIRSGLDARALVLIGREERGSRLRRSSAEIVDALVAVAKELRAARKRNEQLGLSEEEAAFYDALAGRSDDLKADPALAEIAQKLVAEIRKDLSVDWTSRENAEASVRRAIKNLLRRTKFTAIAPAGPGRRGRRRAKAS